jgi:hypothetical protein
MNNKENRSELNESIKSTLSVLDNDDKTTSSAIHASVASHTLETVSAYIRDSISHIRTESGNNINQLHHPTDIRNANITRSNLQNQNEEATIPLCTVIDLTQASSSSVPEKGHFKKNEETSTLTAAFTSTEEEEKGKSNRNFTCSRKCEYEDCLKNSEGSTRFCIRHGGKKYKRLKCKYEDCDKYSQGSTRCCIEHGGKKGSDLYHLQLISIVMHGNRSSFL